MWKEDIYIKWIDGGTIENDGSMEIDIQLDNKIY